MALSKKTINKHNIKRAEVFAEHGLGNHDVRYAHPAFLGFGDGSDHNCCLCDHKHIKWLFAIRFDAPDLTVALGKVATGLVRTDEVTLSAIGSKCITDWLDAVPDSVEKLEALKRWSVEMDKCKEAMKVKVCEDLCAELAEERGWAVPEDSTARKVVHTVGFKSTGYLARMAIPWKERKRFNKTAAKVLYGTCVRKTAQTWIKNLELVLAEQAKVDAKKAAEAPAATAAPVSDLPEDLLNMKDPEEAKLILLGRQAWIAWDQSADPDRLNEWERTTFADIGQKVVKYRSFCPSPSKQKGLYEKLLTKLLGELEVAPWSAEPVAAGALPGAFTYLSLSEIAGARY